MVRSGGAQECARYIGDVPLFAIGTASLPDRLYLDHAATTPILPEAAAAVTGGLARWANPSSPHAEGRAAKAALEDARGRIAAAYDWKGEVIFTSGASESLGMALARSIVDRRLISAVEHDSVIRAAVDAAVLPVDSSGLVDVPALDAALAMPGRPLVAIQWANSETGVRQPIATLAARIKAAGGLFLIDAAQMPAGADPDVAACADFIAISAHKRGGPPGIGGLLVRDLGTLMPSGGQERGYRPGTENLPGALGFASALEIPEDIAAMATLRARLDDAIMRSGGDVVAAGRERHPAIGSYRMRGLAATTQLIRFDMAGIAVSAGSACSSGSMKPSHVLGAMGWSVDASREVVRVSFGRATTIADIDRFVAEWRTISRSARAFAA